MNTTEPQAWRQRRAAVSRRPVPVGPCPAELLAHVGLVNRCTGGPQEPPRAAFASRDFVQELQSAFAGLPAPVLALLPEGFLGIYLAHGLGCSALVDVIRHDGDGLGIALVMDVDAFEARAANDWATWEEREPFAEDDVPVLDVSIAAAGGDHRRAAFQFSLLHEIGHVLVWERDFLPAWWMAPSQLGPAADYAFLDLAWTIDGQHAMVPRCPAVASLRERVAFHAQAQLPAAAAPSLYAGLQHTDFPTLYAIANPYEDFSECLAIHVHTRLMDRPYRLELHGGPQGLLVDDAASVATRCARKFAFIDSLLAS